MVFGKTVKKHMFDTFVTYGYITFFMQWWSLWCQRSEASNLHSSTLLCSQTGRNRQSRFVGSLQHHLGKTGKMANYPIRSKHRIAHSTTCILQIHVSDCTTVEYISPSWMTWSIGQVWRIFRDARELCYLRRQLEQRSPTRWPWRLWDSQPVKHHKEPENSLMGWCLHAVSMVFHEAVPKQASGAWQTWWEHCQTFAIQALTCQQKHLKMIHTKNQHLKPNIWSCFKTLHGWTGWFAWFVRGRNLGSSFCFPMHSNLHIWLVNVCDVLGVDVAGWMTWRWTLHWKLWTEPEQLDGLVLQAHGQLLEDDWTWLSETWEQPDCSNKNTTEPQCQKMPEILNFVLVLVWKQHTNTLEMLSVLIPHLISLCDTGDLRLSKYIRILQDNYKAVPGAQPVVSFYTYMACKMSS